jgi:hypothetical protein
MNIEREHGGSYWTQTFAYIAYCGRKTTNAFDSIPGRNFMEHGYFYRCRWRSSSAIMKELISAQRLRTGTTS